MAASELNVTKRESVGKGISRSLRRQGLAPAVVYGAGMEPVAVTVEPKALKKAIATEAGWNTIITLKGDGAFDGKAVILKDMQVDPIRQDVMHADFQAIDLQQNVHVMVPVHPVGKSAGEKIGGRLEVIRHELEVVCLPTAIPKAIEVDVTALEIGDVIHVNEIVPPAGAVIPHEVNFTVVTCTGHKPEEEEGAEEAAEGEGEAS
ncbi:50S ribosomal protein L25 [Desulfuromonas versatilis]|uniref:Large ribosomal subunit protein bL25 n=1 Tax=Desulfuromonas versatilis TaxID=2802975 RepID=A0ABM8HZI8_9BACT|nr:50S ribosomal protein L25/general stress protein Ctc [Desulfuromonas versatilis]BCR05922.1 50S ribosomal protein L25 [Desulfuromonas versatilis]